METVYMRHPKVDGPPVEVPKSAMPHWSGGGWEECEPPEPVREPRDKKNPSSTRTERRRTTTSSKED